MQRSETKSEVRDQRPSQRAEAVKFQDETALEAAGILGRESIDCEVVDSRTLVPLDRKGILASVRKTYALVVVHEAVKIAGPGAEISAMVAEEGFEYLNAPIVRVAAPFCPIPFRSNLEQAYLPTVDEIVQVVRMLPTDMRPAFA